MAGLHALRCDKCGYTTYPRHSRCSSCKSTSFSEAPLRVGTVLTFTRLNATRPGFPKPLTLAIAEFESGVKVLAKLDWGEASIGMKVIISEDLATPGFKFVPAE